MSAEENKAVIKRAFEARNQKNVDAARELHTDDYIHHFHSGGVKGFNDLYGTPRSQLTVDDMVAEGDRVAVWFSAQRDGEDKRNMCFIMRSAGGKIAESWNMISIQSGSFGALPHE